MSDGTDASDRFDVTAGTPTIALNSRIEINTIDVATYTLRGLGGDDTFNIAAGSGACTINVQGDDSANRQQRAELHRYRSCAAMVWSTLGNSSLDDSSTGTFTGRLLQWHRYLELLPWALGRELP